MEYHVREEYRTLPEGNLSAAIFVSSRVVMLWYAPTEPGTTRQPSIVVISVSFTASVQGWKERVAASRRRWSCAPSAHEAPSIPDPREVREVREVQSWLRAVVR
jgi:predicted membrane-bound mannosyltransferase